MDAEHYRMTLESKIGFKSEDLLSIWTFWRRLAHVRRDSRGVPEVAPHIRAGLGRVGGRDGVRYPRGGGGEGRRLDHHHRGVGGVPEAGRRWEQASEDRKGVRGQPRRRRRGVCVLRQGGVPSHVLCHAHATVPGGP